MLEKPANGRCTRLRKLSEIGVKMTALERDQLLRLEGALVGGQRQIGYGDRIVQRSDHKKRGRVNAGAQTPRLTMRAARGDLEVAEFSQIPSSIGFRET